MTEYKRFDGESDEELIYRITGDKSKIGSWKDVADILNELLGTEYTESKFRKQRQAFDKMFAANQSKFISDDKILNEICEKQRELERLKIQYRDERNAWNNQNRIAARVEQKLDYLGEVLAQNGKVDFTSYDTIHIDSDNDLAIMLSDLHIGMEFNSVFGKYNSDIARLRLQKYLDEILKIQQRHNSKNAYILMAGDEISGSIHKSIQITNRENVIEQIKIASELITSFCYELSKHFETVLVTSVAGNHSRIDKKEDALNDERLDDLIAFIMEKSLNHINNITMLTHRKLDPTIADICIRGNTYLLCHGDMDSVTESGIMRLCSTVGIFPYGIFMGHRHTPAYSEINGVRIIQSGSLCGSGDDYTMSKRLYGTPNQTVCVCNTNGIECIYNVELK